MASGSMGTVSGLRAQVRRFINDELNDNGADACAVLNSPDYGVSGHQTCAQKWDASLHELTPSQRGALNDDARVVPTADVTRADHGLVATITRPTPLIGSSSRFYWTNNCWMLER